MFWSIWSRNLIMALHFHLNGEGTWSSCIDDDSSFYFYESRSSITIVIIAKV